MQALTAFPFTSKLTYDSTGWPQLDRAVDAEVLRRCLKNYFSSGLFLTGSARCFQVNAPADGSATIKVAPGVCLISGVTGYIDEETTVELPAGDKALARIDTVVLRLNDNTEYRNIYIDVVQGTPASKPTAPTLSRSDSIYELGLADIYRNANSTTAEGSAITDTRLDSTRCGQANAISEINTKEFMRQLGGMYDDFNAWFDSIRGILDEDAAGHLQNEIDALRAEMGKKTGAGGSRFNLKFNFDDGADFTDCTYKLTVGGSIREGSFSKDKADILEDGVLTVGDAELVATYKAAGEERRSSAKISAPYYGDYYITAEVSSAFNHANWLKSIGKDASAYSTLADIFADEALTRELMTRHASADYLAKNKVTEDDLAAFTSSRVAVKWIGLRDYICDKLFAKSEWKTALLSSEHWAYILKDSVPTMTRETIPEGTVSTDSHAQASGYADYKAFDGDASSAWMPYNSGRSGWLKYEFTKPIIVKKLLIQAQTSGANYMPDGVILYGVNGDTETKLFETTNGAKDEAAHYYGIENDTEYKAYKLQLSNSTNTLRVGIVNFFGRLAEADTSEWEFGNEDITMLYDHGVEASGFEYKKWYYKANIMGNITKRDDWTSILSEQRASAFSGYIVDNGGGSYSKFFVNKKVEANTEYGSLLACTEYNDPLSFPTTAASTDIKNGLNQLDISAAKQNGLFVCVGSTQAVPNIVLNVTQMYLKK